MAPVDSFTVLQNQTVAQLILRYLALEGVHKLFGIPGAAVAHLLTELKNQREHFEYVICRQETGAAYIADGFARMTGTLGVVLTTSGPGATNALTGTMNAQASGVSILAITGEIAEQYFGEGYLQEGVDAGLDIEAIYKNATRYSSMITSATNFQTLFSQALRDALSVPGTAVHLSLPDDIAGTVVPSIKFPTSPANYRSLPEASNPRRTQQIFEYLIAAERPLLFVGNGCRTALRDADRLARLVRFVDRFALPVMTTPDAKALFPETHAMSLRAYGIAACEWPKYYLQPSLVDPRLPPAYDALCILASQMGELSTDKWAPILVPQGPIMQVDLDQGVIARAIPIDLGVVAEVGATIDELCALGERTAPPPPVEGRRAFVAEIKRRFSPYVDPDKRSSEASPILPQALMKCINDALPPRAAVFVDAGNCVGWSLHDLELDPPREIHTALSMGPMGFGVGSVIGAKLGAPDRTCIGIVGDGAFMMHGNEVSTAAAHQVGAIFVVLNDNDLQMVNQGQAHFFPDPKDPNVWTNYYRIGNPDLAAWARAMGADAHDVRSPAEMRRVFPEAIRRADEHRRPQVIVAHIDRKEAPPYYPPTPKK